MRNTRTDKKAKGQALLELSIFGALFLVFLGVLLSWGLRYNFEQQVLQRTFRKALYYSNARQQPRGSIAYLNIEDRHTPDPRDTFAVGSVTPTQSSVSLVRDYELYKTADDEASLPVLALDIKGLQNGCPGSYLSDLGTAPPCLYLTAGFANPPLRRIFVGGSGTCQDRYRKIKKYNFIFGDINVTKLKGDNMVPWNPAKDDDDEWNGWIRVIDSCEGEILNFGSCDRQCKMFTDTAFCRRVCEKEGKSDCVGICNQVIDEPWYCSKLDQLFSFAANFTDEDYKNMGVQMDSTIARNRTDNTLTKRENAERIATTDTFNWSKALRRMFVFRPYMDTSGNVRRLPVSSSVKQQRTRTWSVPW